MLWLPHHAITPRPLSATDYAPMAWGDAVNPLRERGKKPDNHGLRRSAQDDPGNWINQDIERAEKARSKMRKAALGWLWQAARLTLCGMSECKTHGARGANPRRRAAERFPDRGKTSESARARARLGGHTTFPFDRHPPLPSVASRRVAEELLEQKLSLLAIDIGGCEQGHHDASPCSRARIPMLGARASQRTPAAARLVGAVFEDARQQREEPRKRVSDGTNSLAVLHEAMVDRGGGKATNGGPRIRR